MCDIYRCVYPHVCLSVCVCVCNPTTSASTKRWKSNRLTCTPEPTKILFMNARVSVSFFISENLLVVWSQKTPPPWDPHATFLSSFKKTWFLWSVKCDATADLRTRQKMCRGLKFHASDKKDLHLKKKVYSNTVYIHIYYIPIKLATLTFLVRVCALELLRDARFKSLWSSNCIQVRQVLAKPRYVHPNPSTASGHYRPHPLQFYWETKPAIVLCRLNVAV